MSLKSLFQNSYFYLFLGCMGTLGSLGITLFMAENANSAPITDLAYNNRVSTEGEMKKHQG